jgi:hypothetical protein
MVLRIVSGLIAVATRSRHWSLLRRQASRLHRRCVRQCYTVGYFPSTITTSEKTLGLYWSTSRRKRIYYCSNEIAATHRTTGVHVEIDFLQTGLQRFRYRLNPSGGLFERGREILTVIIEGLNNMLIAARPTVRPSTI